MKGMQIGWVVLSQAKLMVSFLSHLCQFEIAVVGFFTSLMVGTVLSTIVVDKYSKVSTTLTGVKLIKLA